MKIHRASLVAALALGLSAPAFAQAPAAVPAPTTAAQNPNEIVCQKQEETGSRLAKKKICMTRAEWADRQLQDRQELERAQTRRGMKGE